jgi:hypothetical protein
MSVVFAQDVCVLGVVAQWPVPPQAQTLASPMKKNVGLHWSSIENEACLLDYLQTRQSCRPGNVQPSSLPLLISAILPFARFSLVAILIDFATQLVSINSLVVANQINPCEKMADKPVDFSDLLIRKSPDAENDEQCYCDLKSLVHVCKCPMCDAEFENTTVDSGIIKNQHCPRHRMRVAICGWPRPLCNTCAQDWTVRSGDGGPTTFTNRRTGKTIYPNYA